MSAQTAILQKFGAPGADYQAKFCEVWDIQKDFPWTKDITNSVTGQPWKRVLINKEFKFKIFRAFQNLHKAGCHTEIKTFDGCYEARQVRGRDSKSLHAWAMAFDLNAASEKLAQEKTNWSAQFLSIMRAAGIFCGADWKGRKDSMHFAHYNG